MASRDGKIVIENTLDARLDVVFRKKLPEVYYIDSNFCTDTRKFLCNLQKYITSYTKIGFLIPIRFIKNYSLLSYAHCYILLGFSDSQETLWSSSCLMEQKGVCVFILFAKSYGANVETGFPAI